MLQSINSASSALRAYSNAMDVTANNIANVNTPAFKSFSSTFADIAGGGVRMNALRSDNGGYFLYTGNFLDTAINGNGYFKISEPDGSTSLTRRGDFSLDGAGNLVTHNGGIVAANVSNGSNIEITQNGEIYSGGQLTGRIEVVDANGNPVVGGYNLESGMLEASDADMARNIVDNIMYSNSYKSNIASLRTSDEMLGTIIDMTA